MPEILSMKSLRTAVKNGSIDTVIAAFPDMQGRLMGKRFHAQFFVNNAWEETHCCNYLIATDLEMATVDGYESTSWSAGYGDYVMRPDLETLCVLPWLESTALVLCDLQDHHSHELVPHAPRTVLKQQLKKAEDLGLSMMAATELEFFVFRETFETIRDGGYHVMSPISPYNEDYHIFQTTKEESLMRQIRNGLHGAGIIVENTKGEADAGQAEINVHYADALRMGDVHVMVKNAVKEIAFLNDRAITFLAKWHHDYAGSSSHIHQSLLGANGEAVFFDPAQPHGMSQMMQSYLAGLLTYADDTTYFLAPYVNSYKRFKAGTFAPTRAIWSIDNRTAGYRVVAENNQNIRVECRVGGSDLNPYLALASQLAAGLKGIEENLTLEAEFTGDAYQADTLRSIPASLRDATVALDQSEMLRAAMGNTVIDHYVRAARWEQEDFDSKVTDYEVRRGFERA